MAVIDLRENPNVDLAIANSIGQGISAGINEYKRTKLENGIIQTLQKGTSMNWTPEQTRAELLKLPDIINSQIGNEIAQAQFGLGRYYQNPLDTQYKQSQIERNQAYSRYLEQGGARGVGGSDLNKVGKINTIKNGLFKQWDIADTAGDEKTKAEIQARIDYWNKVENELTGLKIGEPVPPALSKAISDMNNVDINALGMSPKNNPVSTKADQQVQKELSKAQPKPGNVLTFEEAQDWLSPENKKTANPTLPTSKSVSDIDAQALGMKPFEVPVKVNSEAELNKLPSGIIIIAPDGSVRRKM